MASTGIFSEADLLFFLDHPETLKAKEKLDKQQWALYARVSPRCADDAHVNGLVCQSKREKVGPRCARSGVDQLKMTRAAATNGDVETETEAGRPT